MQNTYVEKEHTHSQGHKPPQVLYIIYDGVQQLFVFHFSFTIKPECYYWRQMKILTVEDQERQLFLGSW